MALPAAVETKRGDPLKGDPPMEEAKEAPLKEAVERVRGEDLPREEAPPREEAKEAPLKEAVEERVREEDLPREEAPPREEAVVMRGREEAPPREDLPKGKVKEEGLLMVEREGRESTTGCLDTT